MIWTCRCQTALLRCQTLTGPGKHLESFGYGEARIGWTKDHRSGHLCLSLFDHISSGPSEPVPKIWLNDPRDIC